MPGATLGSGTFGSGTFGGGAGTTTVRTPARPRRLDDRLSLAVTQANGRVVNWSAGEAEIEDLLQSLAFTTQDPGGYGTLDCQLLRRIDRDYSDQDIFDHVDCYGPGIRKAWEGRMQRFPRQHGQETSIAPGAVGWGAHMKDNETVRFLGVNIDLTSWQGPSVQRKTDLLTSGIDCEEPSVVQDPSGEAALEESFTGAWTRDHRVEAFFNAQGLDIEELQYAHKKGPNVTAGGGFGGDCFLSDDDLLGSVDTSGSLIAGSPGFGSLAATQAGRKWAMLRFFNAAAGGTDGQVYPWWWTVAAAFGDHGLTRYGDLTQTEAQGLRASDMIAHVIGRFCPHLRYTTGDGGSIQASADFAVPHASWLDPTTVEEIVLACNAYHQWHWGIWKDRTFHFRQPDPQRDTVWELRLDRGDLVGLEGWDADDLRNGVYVTYPDSTGKTKSVGPPGSGADLESAALLDTDPQNPANTHDLRRWQKVELPFPSYPTGAEAIGVAWLSEHTHPQRRGEATVRFSAIHPTEGEVPAWRIPAADWARFSDHPADVPRKIAETRYVHADRSNTLSLDNGADRIDAFFERLGIGLTGVLT